MISEQQDHLHSVLAQAHKSLNGLNDELIAAVRNFTLQIQELALVWQRAHACKDKRRRWRRRRNKQFETNRSTN